MSNLCSQLVSTAHKWLKKSDAVDSRVQMNAFKPLSWLRNMWICLLMSRSNFPWQLCLLAHCAHDCLSLWPTALTCRGRRSDMWAGDSWTADSFSLHPSPQHITLSQLLRSEFIWDFRWDKEISSTVCFTQKAWNSWICRRKAPCGSEQRLEVFVFSVPKGQKRNVWSQDFFF